MKEDNWGDKNKLTLHKAGNLHQESIAKCGRRQDSKVS